MESKRKIIDHLQNPTIYRVSTGAVGTVWKQRLFARARLAEDLNRLLNRDKTPFWVWLLVILVPIGGIALFLLDFFEEFKLSVWLNQEVVSLSAPLSSLGLPEVVVFGIVVNLVFFSFRFLGREAGS